MEKVVAKRTLKKSYFKENNFNLENITEDVPKEKTKNNKTSLKEKMLFKIALQTITMISIMFFVLAIKFFKIDVVKDSDISKKIVKEYKKTYSLNGVYEKTYEISKSTYTFLKPIIPSEIKEITKITYLKVKEKIENKDIGGKEVEIYEESSNSKSENKEKENVGTSVDYEEEAISVVSSVSTEATALDKIKETNVEFVKPLSGVITSRFGAREVIFEGVDSYHTGIDIAADTGKSIVSSIEGTVTVATNNKYNGNYVEVTNGKIVTKYCHMSKISVKKGAKIKAGQKVGEVGSTGLATGPHLHFEVVYDGTKINPELVLDF